MIDEATVIASIKVVTRYFLSKDNTISRVSTAESNLYPGASFQACYGTNSEENAFNACFKATKNYLQMD